MPETFQSLSIPVGDVTDRTAPLPSIAQQAAIENAQKKKRGVEFRDIKAIVDQDFLHSNIGRFFDDLGEKFDGDFNMPAPDAPEGRELWAGIDPADVDLFLHARSQDHFLRLKDRYQKQRAIEAQLAETGWAGTALRLGVNLADPIGLAASLASGPAGWLSKGSRIRAFLKAGALGAATNAALEAAALPGSMVRDSADVALSAIFGFGLGGLSGLLIRNAERAKAAAALSRLERRIIAEELIEEAAKRGKVIQLSDAEKVVDDVRRGKPKDTPPAPRETPPADARIPSPSTPPGPRLIDTGLAAAPARVIGKFAAKYLQPQEAERVLALATKRRLTKDEAAELVGLVRRTLDEDLKAVTAGINDTIPPALVKRMERVVAETEDGISKAEVLGDDVPKFDPKRDSVGAMRATEARPVSDTEWLEEIAKPVGMTAKELQDFIGFGGFGVRYDYASVLRGVDDPELRGTIGLLVDDPVGSKDGSVSPIGATAEASRLSKLYRARLVDEMDRQYVAWLKAQGIDGLRTRLSPTLNDQFSTEVGLVLSNIPGNYSPQARAAASSLRQILSEIGDQLVDLGILSEKLDNYFPRKINHEAVEEANVRFHTEALEELFYQSVNRGAWARAMRASLPEEKAEELIRKVSKGYLKRIREVGRGIDLEIMHGVSGRNIEYLKELLEEGGADDDLIEYVVGEMKRQLEKSGKDDAGKPSFAKHRLQLDETVSIQAWDHVDPKGGMKELSIAGLLEKNANIVLHRYIDSTVGRIAMAKIIGIKNDGDFRRLIKAARSRIDDKDLREKYAKYAQDAYDFLVGRPLEADPDGRAARIARAIRNFNMARVGSSFGLAQIADLGNVVAVGGIRGLLAGMRDFRLLTQRGADGRLTAGLSRELREFGALGLDHLSTSMWASEYGDVFSTRTGRAQFALRGVSRFVAVASGMTKINEWSQMVVGRMMVNRIAKGQLNEKRLAYLGLSKEDADRIVAKLKQTATFDSDGNVSSMGLDKWLGDDSLLRDKFVQALRKGATRAVQENDFGATFPFMHSTLGKMVTQFRNFVLVAWSKQTLHSLNMRDWEAFVNFVWSMFFGSLSYMAYVSTQKPPEDWAEAMTPTKLAAAGFARSGMSSLIPMLIDTPLTFAGFDPLFSFRNSGLPSNALAGIPAVELADRLQRGASSVVQSAIDPDRSFSERDLENWRRLMPLQNFWGVSQITEAAAESFGLPEESR